MITRKRKTAAFIFCVTLLLAVLFFWGICAGSVYINPRRMLDVFLMSGEDRVAREILLDIRLPRILMAFITGMMLAAGGAVSQAVFGNPLADPYIIGISSGAVAGVSLAFAFKFPEYLYGFFAFAGSAGAAFMIFRLSGDRGGRVNTGTILIVGVALSAVLGALSSLIMYLAGQDAYRIMIWTMGWLGAASWSKIAVIIVPWFLAMAYFMFHRFELDALLAGDAEAHSLGVAVGKLKRNLLLAVSLSAAFSVALTGMIGFVGLIVPHATRLCVGNSHSRLIPLASCAGGTFLLMADTIARTVIAPVEIPPGVVTAVFGAPFFMLLALRANRRNYDGA
jgi:iron complex transport system permease protein